MDWLVGAVEPVVLGGVAVAMVTGAEVAGLEVGVVYHEEYIHLVLSSDELRFPTRFRSL